MSECPRPYAPWAYAMTIAYAPLRCIACVVLISSLVACGAQDTPPTAPRTKVMLIAIDGATWAVIRPMTEAGRLPNFKRLVQEGATGNLLTITEPHQYQSAALWTTVATGKHPSEHGIKANTLHDGELPTSNMRKTRSIWNILGDYELTVGTVGYFVTWPVEEVNGYMVSDRAWATKLERNAYPADLLTPDEADRFWVWDPVGEANIQALRRFIGFDFNPQDIDLSTEMVSSRRNHLINERLNWVYPRDESYARIGLRLLTQQRPDLYAIYFQGVDFVSHGFWAYHQPDWDGYHPDAREMLTEENIALMGDVIRNYYEYQDELLGRFLDAADSDTLVLVTSDHGFGPGQHNHTYLTGTHRVEGILAAWGRGARHGKQIADATLFDIAPTILHVLGLPVADDMPGRVLLELFDNSVSENVDRVATHESTNDPRVNGIPIGSSVDEQIKKRLKGLGYTDPGE